MALHRANPKVTDLDLSSRPEPAEPAAAVAADSKDPFLAALGERTRALRARRGMTRKSLAQAAGVSERHVANVEMGVGNASVQFLRQLANALDCSLAEMVGDESASSPEWLMIREILRGRGEAELAEARAALTAMFGAPASAAARRERIALIGLRGAGKSSLGRALAERLRVPFIELNRRIEALAGCTLSEIHSLYGPAAYRRYERRALDDVVNRHRQVVIATPGGVVSDAATFNRLLDQCTTVWLQATPDEHMNRVLAQGDYRPMAGNGEAMDDLRRILAGRSPFYAKADVAVSTAGKSIEESFAALRDAVADVAVAVRQAAD